MRSPSSNTVIHRAGALLVACVSSACGGAVDPPALGGGALRDAGADAQATSDASNANDASVCAADTQTDPHNCGACGHDCHADTCIQGTCTRTTCIPTTLATGQQTPLSIATDATRVYWTSEAAAISACPLDGCAGPPTPLDPATGNADDLMLVGRAAYWRGGRIDEVRTCSVDDCPGTLKLFASGFGAPLATDGTSLYMDGHAISRCPLSGCGAGGPTVLTSGPDPGGVAIRGASMYFVDRVHGELHECATDGCGVRDRVMASGLGASLVETADDSNVYLVHYYYEASMYVNDLLACPLAGCAGGPAVVAARRGGVIAVVVSDGAHVYWIETSRRGTVQRCEVSGCDGRPTLLASGQDGVRGITLDATHVYWTNGSGGQVMKCAK